ncbi:hypothetical protein [Brevibacterium litoralis]|uniref:hypothetical protein n=1 Tax=Brevibacterium litoralis TaxID=3138935 RepID=UPI0032EFBE74
MTAVWNPTPELAPDAEAPLDGWYTVNTLFKAVLEPSPYTDSEALFGAAVEGFREGRLRPEAIDREAVEGNFRRGITHFARSCGSLAEAGLTSLVWSVLAHAVHFSALAPKRLPGTAEALEALAMLLPTAQTAVESGTAAPEVLDLPGVRAWAERPGRSRPVLLAKDLVARLPAMTAAPTAPEDFDTRWTEGAGAADNPVGVDSLEAERADEASENFGDAALLVRLDGLLGSMFHLEIRYANFALRNGRWRASQVPVERARVKGPIGLDPVGQLVWDAEAGDLVFAPRSELADQPWVRTGDPLPVPSAFVRAVLIFVSDGADGGAKKERARLSAFDCAPYRPGGDFNPVAVGSPAVARELRGLLERGEVGPDPKPFLASLSAVPTTVPALWPVLPVFVEAVARAVEEQVRDGVAPSKVKLPTWTGRLLDAALHWLPYLAEAHRRGFIPEAAHPDLRFPGLDALADLKKRGAAVAKAVELRAALVAAGLRG